MAVNGNPEGTAGEQVQPDAGSGAAGSRDESLLGTLDGAAPKGGVSKLSPELQKELESLDPRDLPDATRIRLEKPFLSEFTKQSQAMRAREAELDRQQSRLFELTTGALAQRGVNPTPNQLETLKEKIKSGDFTMEALPEFLDTWYKSTVQPRVDGMTVNQIMADTQREYPVLLEPEVARATNQLFQQNPELVEMSRAGGLRGTHWVLRGIAQDHMLSRTRTELETLKGKYASDIESAKKTAVDDYKRKAMGLPAETSRAGTTMRSEGGGDRIPTIRQAMDEAWEETFGKGN